MLGGINPRQMQGMMKKMGISQSEIPSKRVIIEKIDGEKIIIENPEVMRIKMGGQNSFQITGEERVETAELEISPEDIKLVMQKTNSSKEEAIEALKETKDLTEAIMKLS